MCSICGIAPAREPYGAACGPGCAQVYGTPGDLEGEDALLIVAFVLVVIVIVTLAAVL